LASFAAAAPPARGHLLADRSLLPRLISSADSIYFSGRRLLSRYRLLSGSLILWRLLLGSLILWKSLIVEVAAQIEQLRPPPARIAPRIGLLLFAQIGPSRLFGIGPLLLSSVR
jgi:hypothetical protein